MAIKIKRSTTASSVPPSLVTGELAINEADGKLYYRASTGTVTQFGPALFASASTNTGDEVAEYATTSAFPATGSTTVLYLATDASRAYRWTGSVYVEVGPTSLSGGSSGPSLALVLALT